MPMGAVNAHCVWTSQVRKLPSGLRDALLSSYPPVFFREILQRTSVTSCPLYLFDKRLYSHYSRHGLQWPIRLRFGAREISTASFHFLAATCTIIKELNPRGCGLTSSYSPSGTLVHMCCFVLRSFDTNSLADSCFFAINGNRERNLASTLCAAHLKHQGSSIFNCLLRRRWTAQATIIISSKNAYWTVPSAFQHTISLHHTRTTSISLPSDSPLQIYSNGLIIVAR